MVSGTVDGDDTGTPVAPIDVNQLITGFLIFIGFTLTAFVGQGFALRSDLKNSIPKDAVDAMVNPILQTTYNGWQQLGMTVKQTPGIHDDILYAIGNVPLETLAKKLEALGYELKPVPMGGTNEEANPTGAGDGI